MLEVNKGAILNVTNGDYFNEYFLKKFGGHALPFCEDMMDGEAHEVVYSNEFIAKRCNALSVSEEEYRSKMHVYNAINNDKDKFSELCLWFGKDTFCQMNLITLLAYLEEIDYKGNVTLNYIDDETFEVIEENITVHLSGYKKIYSEMLLSHKQPTEIGVLSGKAIDLYFDYHSEDGTLAQMVKENINDDEYSLLCRLLSSSAEYGLSDIQAKGIIDRVKNSK